MHIPDNTGIKVQQPSRKKNEAPSDESDTADSEEEPKSDSEANGESQPIPNGSEELEDSGASGSLNGQHPCVCLDPDALIFCTAD